nr:PAS domain-containing protein [uncultured Desulfobulbus sp.]
MQTQLAAVLANMNSGVVVFDLEGRIIHTNDALARILEFQNKSEFPLNIRCLEHLFQHYYSLDGRQVLLSELFH